MNEQKRLDGPELEQEITEFAELLYNFREALDIKTIKANIESFLLANHLIQLPKDRPDKEKKEELVEKCMPTLERFEEVEKHVFYPIPTPKEFAATIRIYASTLARESIKNTLALIPDIEELKEELRVGNILTAELTDKCRELELQIEEAKKQYKDYIVSWLGDIFLCELYNTKQRDELCRSMWQALKG